MVDEFQQGVGKGFVQVFDQVIQPLIRRRPCHGHHGKGLPQRLLLHLEKHPLFGLTGLNKMLVDVMLHIPQQGLADLEGRLVKDG